jgi:hypothetical protein
MGIRQTLPLENPRMCHDASGPETTSRRLPLCHEPIKRDFGYFNQREISQRRADEKAAAAV